MKISKIVDLYASQWGNAVYATTVKNEMRYHTRVPRNAGTPVSVGQTAHNRVQVEVHAGVARMELRSTWLWIGSKAWAEAVTSTYFEWVGDGPAPDICTYCGFNNGPHGESRNGWDCGYCGSN